MTTTANGELQSDASIHAAPGVYQPQEDSLLLASEMIRSASPRGKKVLDLCTGSGILAIEAARHGARKVAAYDISPEAVACTAQNAARNRVHVDAFIGSIGEAVRYAPYDLVVCNPPYVPSSMPLSSTGEERAWIGGMNGRVVLDPLCMNARSLLVKGGVMLLVQSEYSCPQATFHQLSRLGFDCAVAASRTIDFGPVMNRHAQWLEKEKMLPPGKRTEELVVIRAERR